MAVDFTSAAMPEPASMPPGVSLEALSADAERVASAAAAATLPDHIDFGIWSGVDRLGYWRQLLAGEGPCGSLMHAASRMIRDQTGAIVGVAAVTRMAASEWWPGGPWIPEIFVVSEYQGRGLGGRLLHHAVRASMEGGYRRLGLTVTEGNPARHLYERFGFAPFRATWLVQRGQ